MLHKFMKMFDKVIKALTIPLAAIMLFIIMMLLSQHTKANSDPATTCNKVAQSFDRRVDVLTNPLVEVAIFTSGVYRCTVTYNKRILLGDVKFTTIPVIIMLTYNPEIRTYIYKTVR